MKVSGKVIDSSNTPLMGVNIYPVRDGSSFGVGATTNYDGTFNDEWNDVTADDTVIFSYLGYETISKRAGQLDNATIILKEDTEQLDEVLITATLPKKAEPKIVDVNKRNAILYSAFGIAGLLGLFLILKSK